MRNPVALKADPDWARAAQLLIDGCANNAATRVELLERLALALGDSLYPAFLNVLLVVGERGSSDAQSGVADALADALRSGRLPEGRRNAWGMGATLGAALGPLEYLCVWMADRQAAERPSPLAFERALTALLRLVSHSDRAAALYAARLLELAQQPLDGTYSRAARQALTALGTAWRAGATPAEAADAAQRAAVGGGSSLSELLATNG